MSEIVAAFFKTINNEVKLRQNFSVKNVTADWNCLFTMLALQLQLVGITSTLQTAYRVKSDIVEFLKSDVDIQEGANEPVIFKDRRWNDYVKEMSWHEGTWNEVMIVSTAVRLYHRPIPIVSESA